jgi:hypothetical protein
MIRSSDWPTASSAVKPNIRFAPGFQNVIRPSRSVAMIASEALASSASPSPEGMFIARPCSGPHVDLNPRNFVDK